MNKTQLATTGTANSTFFQFMEDYLIKKGHHLIHRGKVRNTYTSPVRDNILVSISTDRISAFDVVSEQEIPYKGQVLNMIASYFLLNTSDVCKNWFLLLPNNNTTVGVRCKPFKVEMVIRKYLTGSLWRLYKDGVREVCGLHLPDGMLENQKFEHPIITPTTKADQGHDENISKAEIISLGLATSDQWAELEAKTYALFQRGTEMAEKRGLILVDTKYEFGTDINGEILLIDEVHTPDSSRFWESETYQECFKKDLPQKQISKEFFREWLLSIGYNHIKGGELPKIPIEITTEISKRYIGLYERLTGKEFIQQDYKNAKEFCKNF